MALAFNTTMCKFRATSRHGNVVEFGHREDERRSQCFSRVRVHVSGVLGGDVRTVTTVYRLLKLKLKECVNVYDDRTKARTPFATRSAASIACVSLSVCVFVCMCERAFRVNGRAAARRPHHHTAPHSTTPACASPNDVRELVPRSTTHTHTHTKETRASGGGELLSTSSSSSSAGKNTVQ